MSNKSKTTGTEEEAKPALVPKLRFPDFRAAQGWAPEPMGQVYSFKGNNSLARDKLNYVTGSVKNIHYGDIHTKFSTHFDIKKERVPFINDSEPSTVRDENMCIEGDMVFADASEDLADVGKSIEIVSLNGERVVSGLHTILARRIGGRITLGFGGHLFKSAWVRAQIQREAQGAKVLGISPTRLQRICLPLPSDKAEQQKIAECLSSSDDLIAAQARKVNALKTHKKGLMQQLFPREGETQPRLRLPEFQGAGGWEVKRLSSEVNLVSGVHLSPDQYSTTGEVPYFTGPSDFTNDIESVTKWTKRSTSVAAPDDTLITVKGSGVGEVWHSALHAVALGRQLMSVRVKQGSSQFIFQFLQTKKARFEDLGAGNLIPGLSRTDILDMEAPFPSPAEQQRIASCLSSLDALITAETQKLEALKTHKKGLMQRLFPSAEDIDA